MTRTTEGEVGQTERKSGSGKMFWIVGGIVALALIAGIAMQFMQSTGTQGSSNPPVSRDSGAGGSGTGAGSGPEAGNVNPVGSGNVDAKADDSDGVIVEGFSKVPITYDTAGMFIYSLDRDKTVYTFSYDGSLSLYVIAKKDDFGKLSIKYHNMSVKNIYYSSSESNGQIEIAFWAKIENMDYNKIYIDYDNLATEKLPIQKNKFLKSYGVQSKLRPKSKDDLRLAYFLKSGNPDILNNNPYFIIQIGIKQ